MVSMSIARTLCLAAALVAAGCTPAGRSNQARNAGPARPALTAGEFRFDPIERQPLPLGACGMFLWARSGEQPVLVLAAFANPAEARVRLRGRDRVLRRTGASGASQFGHFETQTFSDDRLTLEVAVSFDESRRLSDGAALERGVIRVEDSEGWQTIVPVGGLIGCGA